MSTQHHSQNKVNVYFAPFPLVKHVFDHDHGLSPLRSELYINNESYPTLSSHCKTLEEGIERYYQGHWLKYAPENKQKCYKRNISSLRKSFLVHLPLIIVDIILFFFSLLIVSIIGVVTTGFNIPYVVKAIRLQVKNGIATIATTFSTLWASTPSA